MITAETIVTAIEDTIKQVEQKAKVEGGIGNHDLASRLYFACFTLQSLLDNIRSLERGA